MKVINVLVKTLNLKAAVVAELIQHCTRLEYDSYKFNNERILLRKKQFISEDFKYKHLQSCKQWFIKNDKLKMCLVY